MNSKALELYKNYLAKKLDLIFNTNGEIICNNKIRAQYFTNVDGVIHCYQLELNGYHGKRIVKGYKCSNSHDSYMIRYQPIKKYGYKYTLCFDEAKLDLYLYDRMDREYVKLGLYNDILYDDYFIINNKDKKVYLLYDEKVFDISDYYYKYLIDKEIIRITPNVTGIRSLEQFTSAHFNEIFAKVDEERREIMAAGRKAKEEADNMMREPIAMPKIKSIKEREVIVKENNEKKEEALLLLKKALVMLNLIQENDTTIERVKVTEKDLFVKEDDHLEIVSIYKKALRFLDLSDISFDKADVHGVDFRGCNIGILFNPQKVYKKDLNCCNFDKVFIPPIMNFNRVNIIGCHFSEDDDPQTKDIFNATFGKAIYDETTTYNGISFIKLFESMKI